MANRGSYKTRRQVVRRGLCHPRQIRGGTMNEVNGGTFAERRGPNGQQAASYMNRLLAFFIAVFAVVGCSQDPQPGPEPEPEPPFDSTWFYVTAPCFSDGSFFEWKQGDSLVISEAVSNAELYTVTAQSSGQRVRFKGDFPKNWKTFKAFYPASRALYTSTATNIYIKSPQTYTNADDGMDRESLPLVFYGDSLFKGFTMTPVASLMRCTLSGNDVTSITFTFGDSDNYYLSANKMPVNCSTLNTSNKNASVSTNTQTLKPSLSKAFSPGKYTFTLLTKDERRTSSTYSVSYTKTDGTTVKRSFSNILSLVSAGVQEIPGDENTVVYNSSKVSGTVKDASTGKVLQGVAVSDGINYVLTNTAGFYSFTSDLTKAQNVFVVMPSEYEFDTNEYGGWNNHRFLDTGKSSQQVDFSLTPRDTQTDRYRLLLLGDPQRMSTRKFSLVSWPYVCDAVAQYSKTVDVPLYMVSLGDMVTNEIEVPGMAETYLEIQKTAGLCTFCTPGNHDHVQAADTYYPSVIEFSRWFGPYNYSFNLGKQHFIFLDSCSWGEGGSSSKYHSSLNEQGIVFLEKDLANLDKSVPVHIFTHCPLTKKNGGYWPATNVYHDRMMKALSGRRVEMWYGHIHYNANYSITAEELAKYAPGVVSMGSHVVARCGGAWDCCQELCKDATPRGFVELDIDGTSSHWQYNSIEGEFPQFMNVYTPGQFKGEDIESYDEKAIYLNIYLWDNSWTTPQITIGGSTYTMTKVIDLSDGAYDPLYQHRRAIWEKEGRLDVHPCDAAAIDNMHLFKYVPSTSARSAVFSVTDRWGEKHSMTVSW